MTEQQEAVPTVGYIDEYSQEYRSLFADVRSFEAFKFVHVGMLSAIPRKSLPAIAKLVGLGNSQNLQHLFQNTEWNLESFRDTRLLRIRQAIGEQEIVLCIDETGDAKKGQATDYVAKQFKNGAETILPFNEHPLWEAGMTWKSALNNLLLLLQPYLCWEALEFWLQVFPIAGIKRGLFKLMDFMDSFHILPEATFSVTS
jgi:hypothetical protein